MISKELNKALERNGIFINFNLPLDIIENRKDKILKIYRKKRYEDVNEVLIDFLCFFLDKELLFINKISYPDSMHFKLKNALTITYAVKTIENDFNLTGLIPFGALHRDHMILFIDKNDSVYASMDNILIHFGINPFDALTNILNHKQLERVEI